jgi:hypothetical protein
MVEEALKPNRGLIEHVVGVYGDRRAEYFRSIDCFLLPSRTESIDSLKDCGAATRRADWLHRHAGEELEHLVPRHCLPFHSSKS